MLKHLVKVVKNLFDAKIELYLNTGGDFISINQQSLGQWFAKRFSFHAQCSLVHDLPEFLHNLVKMKAWNIN